MKHYAAISLLVFFVATAAAAAQDSDNVYRAFPTSYDPANGQLIFVANFSPFDFRTINPTQLTPESFDPATGEIVFDNEKKIPIFITAYDGAKQERVEFTKYVRLSSTQIANGQEFSVNVGFNITEIAISSPIGQSPNWVISTTPLPTNRKAKAVPKNYKNFYIVKQYISCEGTNICSQTRTLNAADYKAADKSEFDDTDYASLPTALGTSIEKK